MPSVAYCVATDNFIYVGRDDDNGTSNSATAAPYTVVTAGFSPAVAAGHGEENTDGGGAHSVAVEALLTSADDPAILVPATSLVIQAQSETGTGIWRTTAGGGNDCLRCSSITVAPVPETVRRVKVDVVLSNEMPKAVLWLASYSY